MCAGLVYAQITDTEQKSCHHYMGGKDGAELLRHPANGVTSSALDHICLYVARWCSTQHKSSPAQLARLILGVISFVDIVDVGVLCTAFYVYTEYYVCVCVCSSNQIYGDKHRASVVLCTNTQQVQIINYSADKEGYTPTLLVRLANVGSRPYHHWFCSYGSV